MSEMMTDILLNPARTRIIQYFILHETGTAAEIGDCLPDISKASLYRHLKKMTGCGLLSVVKENKIRGTVEKVYALSRAPMLREGDGDVKQMFYHSLFTLLQDFEHYFRREDADPMRDMLSVTTAILAMSDDEYAEMSREFSGVYQKYLQNKPGENRKLRRITFISSLAATSQRDKGEDVPC